MSEQTEREALSKILFHQDVSNHAANTAPGIGALCDVAADAILAAGFTRQPAAHTVETVEELEALDEFTPVMPPVGIPQFSRTLAANYRWMEAHGGMHDQENWLPATVLVTATQPTASEPSEAQIEAAARSLAATGQTATGGFDAMSQTRRELLMLRAYAALRAANEVRP